VIQAAKLTAMGEMAATVAHQINNPLTTIKLDAELMLLKEDQESARYEPLSAIVRAADRSAEVVKRLLATARPGNPNAPAEPVDVAAIVEDVVALVKTYVERSRVTLDVRLPEEPLPSVWAAPGELDDVWLNLLLNAHDALSGRPDPVIGISVEHLAGDKYVNVEVWDNGPGIPERILNDIFRPFFTTKPEGEGTGLGLHICRQVIERVGGTISVESAPEEGTRFFVKLPTKRGEQ
jgi:C4-dicarboxylate-specific signal transduction histidine kinase